MFEVGKVRDLSDRFEVVSSLRILGIQSAFSHCYQGFLMSSDIVCMSEVGHKNDSFNQLLARKVRLQPPALAPGTPVPDISERWKERLWTPT